MEAPRARKRVGNISEGKVHAIGPHDIPYDSVKKSESTKYVAVGIQINPAHMLPSTVCPFQSRPTYAVTIATPRCAKVMPTYVRIFFSKGIQILRGEGAVSLIDLG